MLRCNSGHYLHVNVFLFLDANKDVPTEETVETIGTENTEDVIADTDTLLRHRHVKH